MKEEFFFLFFLIRGFRYKGTRFIAADNFTIYFHSHKAKTYFYLLKCNLHVITAFNTSFVQGVKKDWISHIRSEDTKQSLCLQIFSVKHNPGQ